MFEGNKVISTHLGPTIFDQIMVIYYAQEL